MGEPHLSPKSKQLPHKPPTRRVRSLFSPLLFLPSSVLSDMFQWAPSPLLFPLSLMLPMFHTQPLSETEQRRPSASVMPSWVLTPTWMDRPWNTRILKTNGPLLSTLVQMSRRSSRIVMVLSRSQYLLVLSRVLTKRLTWFSLMVTLVLMDLDLTMVELVLDAVRLLRLPRSLEDPPVDLLFVSTLVNSVPHMSTDMDPMRNNMPLLHVLTRFMRTTNINLYKLLS